MKYNTKSFQWAIIGAGPAGIAAVGRLMDEGVPPFDILWIDSAFQVGDLGGSWQNVSSNTTVARFTDFLNASSSFDYPKQSECFKLSQLKAEETCLLSDIVAPLQWVSNKLRTEVCSVQTQAKKLALSERKWRIECASDSFQSSNIILATGAVPHLLDHHEVETIPFEIAIDQQKLAQSINPNHTYAVFGSSHSAMIIIRHLVELQVKKILNFYRSPCRYALDLGDSILFDNTGLKGQTALWARENIDGILPPNLVRYPATEHNINRYLPECQHAVYAIGFKRRKDLVIEGYDEAQYNPHVGIIAPGLFGLGIAYPEMKPDKFGSIEEQVGLWKFMLYLNKVLPTWLKYST